MEIERKNLFSVLTYFIGFFLLFFFVLPYIQADIQSKAAFAIGIDSKKICNQTDQFQTPEVRVISFTKHKGELELYCLYVDESKNQYVKANLNKQKVFEAVFIENMNQNSRMYWPIYEASTGK